MRVKETPLPAWRPVGASCTNHHRTLGIHEFRLAWMKGHTATAWSDCFRLRPAGEIQSRSGARNTVTLMKTRKSEHAKAGLRDEAILRVAREDRPEHRERQEKHCRLQTANEDLLLVQPRLLGHRRLRRGRGLARCLPATSAGARAWAWARRARPATTAAERWRRGAFPPPLTPSAPDGTLDAPPRAFGRVYGPAGCLHARKAAR